MLNLLFILFEINIFNCCPANEKGPERKRERAVLTQLAPLPLKPEHLNYRGLFVDKGSGSGIFPDPDPGDPKRPDPTGSGSATLPKIRQKKAFRDNVNQTLPFPAGNRRILG